MSVGFLVAIWLAAVVGLLWLLLWLIERAVRLDPDSQRRWREIERRQKALDEADRHMAGRGE
ncbi:MAG TPA: hypothetical protein VEA41_07930 [Salinarimonas sp.]|nr:hypothetical protein [Salinarimonas sp.]